MEKDKFQELLEAKASAEQELKKLRVPVTILFTDIKGSTAYFEKKGDIAGLKMVQHHNSLLMPVIEREGGYVVKTIGDAIMARFDEPVGAIRAAVGMQRALEADRAVQVEDEQIHIRVGMHTGLGVFKDNDVYGDVVNAASRVNHQAAPDQILITDILLAAAKAADVQVAKLGKAEMKNKDEVMDVYAVAWSAAASEQLIVEIQNKFEGRLNAARRQYDELEEEFENGRDQWRSERRKLSAEIEQLEESMARAREAAHHQASDDLQSELGFRLDEALRARTALQEEIVAERLRWESERNSLRTQIASMQGSVIEAMERSNNPTRTALAVREQVEARVADAKEEWQLQWEGDRRRLNAEIERLKRAPGAVDEKKEAARRALLEKLGKLPAGSAGAVKSTAQWQRELEDAKIRWDTERDQLGLQIKRLENEIRRSEDMLRTEAFQEMRGQYEPKLAEANRERQRLEQEVGALTAELSGERRRSETRIAQLEQALPEAQEAVRRQISAELQGRFDIRIEESSRLKARAERKCQDLSEELDSERRRGKRQIAQLEEQLKEAKENAFKAQRLARLPQ